MFKRVVLIFLCCLWHFADAGAYEYIKLHELFKTLQSDYAERADFQKISLKGLKALSEFDETLKIYNSDSKAFLYEADNLIGIFELPKEKENPLLWRELLTNVLETSSERSAKLSGKESELEAQVLEIITANLDVYSRLEKNPEYKGPLQYTIKQNVLYIHLYSFYDGVADYIRKIVEDHPNAHGLILDLRGNRGGSFSEAIQTAGLFLDGALITYSEDKYKRQHYYTAASGDIFASKPITILTDGQTASAAELVAAAFGEQSRAILIGTKTYGKGSIQNVYKVKSQTLFLTSGHFYTPSGKAVSQHGIIPQICTGIDGSCSVADKTSPDKEIWTAIALIKKNLG